MSDRNIILIVVLVVAIGLGGGAWWAIRSGSVKPDAAPPITIAASPSSARPLPVATKPTTQPLSPPPVVATPSAPLPPKRKPFVFAPYDPIGSFTVVGAGVLEGADLRVDREVWDNISAIDQKQVVDAIFKRVSTAMKITGQAEAANIRLQGQNEGDELRRRGDSLKGDLRIIDAQEKEHLRLIKVEEDIVGLEVRVLDKNTGKPLATMKSGQLWIEGAGGR